MEWNRSPANSTSCPAKKLRTFVTSMRGDTTRSVRENDLTPGLSREWRRSARAPRASSDSWSRRVNLSWATATAEKSGSRGSGGSGPPISIGVVGESARKTAYFIETKNRHRTPLLFLQDVSGFMVGAEAEHAGIIRSGARFVEAMATATVPKVVLTINHASGAGYYAMAGQGFDPDFIFTWPTGRMGVMEGDSAVMALFSERLAALRREGKEPDEELRGRMDEVLADYERHLDALYAGARGWVDAVLLPEETRSALEMALRTAGGERGEGW